MRKYILEETPRVWLDKHFIKRLYIILKKFGVLPENRNNSLKPEKQYINKVQQKEIKTKQKPTEFSFR